MKSFLVILGIILLHTPAVLSSDGNPVNSDRDHSAFSSSYSAEKYDLDRRSGVPPGTGGGASR